MLAAVGGLLLGGLVVKNFGSGPTESSVSVVRASLNLPEGSHFWIDNTSGVALSPDGAHLAYIACLEGLNQIFVRSLDSAEPRRIETEDGATMPFFSPDSQWLGFR